MIISVASGKGGTGKTTVATNLAITIGQNVQFLDCDVEEPNAHIFLKPDIERRYPVMLPIPKVDKEKCVFCGRCQEACTFNAIAVLKNDVLIFDELCHSCGVCSYVCPCGAITEYDKEIGSVEIGRSNQISFVSGILKTGSAISPPVIREMKTNIDFSKTVIIDSPPGTSCPVIEAISASDFCVLVTEPTPFGLSDLSLAVELLRTIGIPFGVVINRSDLGDVGVENYCTTEGIDILMRIPFSREIASAYSRGIPVVEEFPEYKKLYLAMLEKIKRYG